MPLESYTDASVGPDEIHERLITATNLFGRKWNLVIIYELAENGPLGFSSLKGEIEGIWGKVLAQTLDELNRWELIDRSIVDDRPVRVEYSITQRGRRLYPVVTTIRNEFELVSSGTDA